MVDISALSTVAVGLLVSSCDVRIKSSSELGVIAYSRSSFIYTTGDAISISPISTSGSVTISPPLANGLSLSSSGTISGTISGTLPQTTYTLTAAGAGSQQIWTTSIQIQVVALPTIAYSGSPFSVNDGTSTMIAPSTFNSVSEASISPSLPSGISFNPATGVISGTPTVVSASTNYTVTATNLAGKTSTTTLQLGLNFATSLSLFQLGASGATVAASSLISDGSENIYIVGFVSGGVIGTQYNTHSSTDCFVAKFGASGSLIWASQLGTSNASAACEGAGVLVDHSGNVFISGWTNGTIGGAGWAQLGTHGLHDMVLAEFNSNGVLVWSRQWGAAGSGSKTQAGSNLLEDSSGNFYLGGATTGALGTQYGSQGTQDLYVAQITSSGTAGWAIQIGNTSLTGGATSLAFDSLGHLDVAGFTNGTIAGATVVGGAVNTTDNGLLIQLNSSGAVNWIDEASAGASKTVFEGISIDGSNVIHQSGYTLGTYGTQYGSHGSCDGLLASFNSSGALLDWSQIGQSGYCTEYYGITLDSNQNAYLTGQTEGTIGTQYGTHGTVDIFFSQYDSSANYIGSSQWGESGLLTQASHSAAIYSDGLFYITGDASGTLSGETQYGTHGVQDALLSVVQNLSP